MHHLDLAMCYISYFEYDLPFFHTEVKEPLKLAHQTALKLNDSPLKVKLLRKIHFHAEQLVEFVMDKYGICAFHILMPVMLPSPLLVVLKVMYEYLDT